MEYFDGTICFLYTMVRLKMVTCYGTLGRAMKIWHRMIECSCVSKVIQSDEGMKSSLPISTHGGKLLSPLLRAQ